MNESFKLNNDVLKKYSSKTKYTPGFFAFLHTFGRDLKWNPHIHILVAEIKLSNDKSFKFLKNKLYKTYKKGFYVYAEKKKFKNIKDGIEHVTRYRKRHPFHDKMFRMVSNETNNFRKQILKYVIPIQRFFHYNPFNCPHCGEPMTKICRILEVKSV